MTVTILPGNDIIYDLEITQLLDLEVAGFSDGYIPLREIDQEHIEHLVASELTDIPPITVVKTTDGYAVVDGYHRVEAAKALKMITLPAKIGTYANEDEVIEAAFMANLQHGLPANHDNRTMFACWLNDNYEMSQAEIAKRVGMSQPTVSRILRKQKKEHAELDQAMTNADTQEEREYNIQQIDHTKKLLVSMAKFFENERAILGSISGTRSENKRAKALVSLVKPDAEIAEMYDSLARTLNQAAILIRQKLPAKAAANRSK